jgi:HK97 family phage major capsid protein
MPEKYEEIIQAVKTEVQNMGENTKGVLEKLNNEYHELKTLISEKVDDALLTERIDKFATSVSTRQDELDQKQAKAQSELNSRIDQLEVALKRPGGVGNQGDGSSLEKEAKDFFIASLGLKEGSAAHERVEKMDINIEAYAQYQKAFEGFIRRKGDERQMAVEEHKAMMIGSDPDGGYTVPTIMGSRIIQKMFESDPIRQLASVENISSRSIEFMVDWDEASYGWESESVGGAETGTPKFKSKEITTFTMYAKPRATQMLIEDSGINIQNWLADKVANRFARIEGAAFVSGDGVGKPRGFLDYGNGTTYGTIQRVNMGAAAALTADGFVDIKYSLQEEYLTASLAWLMNRSTVASAMKLKDGTGNYIWKPSMMAADPGSSILGIPVRMSTTMPTVAAGALAVALADWKEAYVIVDRLGITIQRDPYTVKPLVEFYTRKRVGGDVVNFDAIKIGVISV